MQLDLSRRLGELWWETLARLGMPKERWLAIDPLARRAAVTGFWLAVGLILIAAFGVWRTSGIIFAIIVFALVVTPWRRLPYGRWIVPAAVLALAVTYPEYRDHLFGSPIFGPAPQMDTMVVMMIFTMMALGLNVVVGYAGLLDLGYVAFYAMGAYMSGGL